MPVYSYQTKTKGKKYRVKCSYYDHNHVRRYVHKRGFNTSKEAKQWEATFLVKMSGTNSLITLSQAIDIFLDYKESRVKSRSMASYDNILRHHVLNYYGDIPLRRIEIRDIESFQKHLADSHLSEKSIQNIQLVFNAMLKYSVRMQYLSTNPFSFVDYVHKNKKRESMLYYTKEEYKEYRSYIEDDTMLLAFDMLYFTGVRIGELEALKWSDIEGANIHVHASWDYREHRISEGTKNGTTRTVPLTENLVDQLKKHHMRYPDTVFIFQSDRVCEPIEPKRFRRFNDSLCEKHNLKRIRLHDFRHSFISLLINSGLTAFEISQFSGNSPQIIEQTYAHMFPEKRNKLLGVLNNF